MNTTKYEIELPTLPDGFEVVGPGNARDGDLHYSPFSKQWAAAHNGQPFSVLARRKRTLADWANEQPLFKALAEMRTWSKEQETLLSFDAGWGGNHGAWLYRSSGAARGYLGLERQPEQFTGTLTLENGKWKDVP